MQPDQTGYLALGARDAPSGAAALARHLGLPLTLPEAPAPSAWAWRTTLPCTNGWLVEFIAPNPAYTGRHPLNIALAEGPPLQTLCWGLTMEDFPLVSGLANRMKRSFSWLEALTDDEDSGPVLGFIGPGLRTDLPGMLFNGPEVTPAPNAVTVLSVHGYLADAARHHAQFGILGVDAPITEGDPEVRTRLRGPRGTLTLSSPPVAFGG